MQINKIKDNGIYKLRFVQDSEDLYEPKNLLQLCDSIEHLDKLYQEMNIEIESHPLIIHELKMRRNTIETMNIVPVSPNVQKIKNKKCLIS